MPARATAGPDLFYLRDKRETLVLETEEFLVRFVERLACPVNDYHLNRQWRRRPRALDLSIEKAPSGLLHGSANTPIVLMHRSLYTVLRPYMSHFLVGAVVQGGRTRAGTDFVSLLCRPAKQIDPHRMASAAHDQCRECGVIWSVNMSETAVVRRSLGKRRVHGASGLLPYIDASLARSLRLARRFPSLRLIPTPVIESPEDGDILPGDPQWNGVFRPQRRKLQQFRACQ